MRKKKNLEARINACSDYLICKLFNTGEEPKRNIIDFREIFGNDNPVMLEIGCGKGGFVHEAARRFGDINYIAAEKSENVIITAMERSAMENVPNIRYINGMAEYLEYVIAPGSSEKIFLNFSCPFPKDRYEKHRLTYKLFLDIYRNILTENGRIYFKTDNLPFFDYSLNSFAENGFKTENVTRDLHNSNITGNITTEYEDYFIGKGFKINYLEAVIKF